MQNTDIEMLPPLVIRSDALAKAQKYCQIVDQLYGPIECIGFLLAHRDEKLPVIRDVLLAPNQTGNGVHVDIAPSGVLAAGRQIASMESMKAVGFFHYHPRMRAFHSGTDDNTHNKLLLDLQNSNMSVYQKSMTVDISFEQSLMTDHNNSWALKSSVFAELPQDTMPAELTITTKRAVVWSLVIGDKGDLYAESAVRIWYPMGGSPESISGEVPVRIRKIRTRSLDVTAMRRDVSACVTPQRQMYYYVNNSCRHCGAQDPFDEMASG